MKGCPRNFRRTLLRISLWVFLGVVTTVGVAWGLAVFVIDGELNTVRPRESGSAESLDEIDDAWRLSIGRVHSTAVPSYGGSQVLIESSSFRSRNKGWTGVDVHELYKDCVLQTGGGTLVSRFAYRLSAGLPFRALSAEQHVPFGALQPEYRFGIEISRDVVWPNGQTGRMNRPLPLLPVSSGFVANTLLYAAIWFGLFFAFGTFKRWNRRRRGLRPNCGHDLRGNPEGVTGCAECGWGRDV